MKLSSVDNYTKTVFFSFLFFFGRIIIRILEFQQQFQYFEFIYRKSIRRHHNPAHKRFVPEGQLEDFFQPGNDGCQVFPRSK